MALDMAPGVLPRRLNVAFLGPSGVGKTSLIRRLTHHAVATDHVPTVGVEETAAEVSSGDGRQLFIELLDFGGNALPAQPYHTLLGGVAAVIFVMDAGDASSLGALDPWIRLVDRHVPATAPRVLLANKADRNHDAAGVPHETLEDVARRTGMLSWAWTVGDAVYGDYVAERGSQRKQSSITKEFEKILRSLRRGAASEAPAPPALGTQSLAALLAASKAPPRSVAAEARRHRRALAAEAERWLWTAQARACRARPSSQPEGRAGARRSLAAADGAGGASPLLDADPAWRHYAGWISRGRAEAVLGGLPHGSFLLHRESERHLVLSIAVGAEGGARRVQHGLVRFEDGELWDADKRHGPYETLSGFLAALGHDWGIPLRGVDFA